MRRKRHIVVLAVLSVLFFVAAAGLSVWMEQRAPVRDRGGAYDLIYLPKPEEARLMSLGFRTVSADYYWVKALQYFTDPSEEANNYRNLGDYLDVVVGVDPDFEYAYKFAGISMPYRVSRLHWVNTRRATRILERGAERFPDNWELHFFLGYNYLNFHYQYEKAAEQFAAAARLPKAPRYLVAFAPRVFSTGGDVDRGIAFAQEVLKSSEDPDVRALMEKRLNDLLTEKVLNRMEKSAVEFKTQQGRFPIDVNELMATGKISHVPKGYWLDAFGTAHAPGSAERMVLHENAKDGNDYQAD
jgi:tetratricopeptide (TPR) repeat protein